MIEHYKNLGLKDIEEEIDNIIYTEEWRDIIGWESIYKVSSFGRVKSLKRQAKVNNGLRGVKEKILSPKIDKDGYLHICLSKNGIHSYKRVHRLVAKEFIPNPQNKPEVNHTKLIKTDNRVQFLEWATNQENISHGMVELPHRNWNPHTKGKFGDLHFNSKKVYCPTLGIYFGSAAEAERELGLNSATVYKVCNGIRFHANGLVFKYVT